jgi:hypothetical protein
LVTSQDITEYVKAQATLVGKVFLATTVGGVAGSVTGAILSFLTAIPFVSSAPHLGELGAAIGFVFAFIEVLASKFK